MEYPCADCPWQALPAAAVQALDAYGLLASPLCGDVPAVGLLVLEVLGLRFSSTAAARGWLENLMLIHGFLRTEAARRAQAQATVEAE